MSTVIRQRAFLPSLIVLLIVGCSTPESRWQRATEQDTLQSYEEYVKHYPASREGLKRVAQKRFADAEKIDSVESWRSFLAKHPDQRELTRKAEERIHSINGAEAYEKARKEDDVAAYAAFLKEYGNLQQQAQDARRRMISKVETIYISIENANCDPIPLALPVISGRRPISWMMAATGTPCESGYKRFVEMMFGGTSPNIRFSCFESEKHDASIKVEICARARQFTYAGGHLVQWSGATITGHATIELGGIELYRERLSGSLIPGRYHTVLPSIHPHTSFGDKTNAPVHMAVLKSNLSSFILKSIDELWGRDAAFEGFTSLFDYVSMLQPDFGHRDGGFSVINPTLLAMWKLDAERTKNCLLDFLSTQPSGWMPIEVRQFLTQTSSRRDKN